MRINLLQIIILLIAGLCIEVAAQQSPMFETNIFFEDARGNRDTISVGYDSLATFDLDTSFGEIEIIKPFDSIFEVRAGIFDPRYREKLSKRIISGTEKIIGSPNDCFDGDNILFYIWAKYQPVKISWDRSTFKNNACVKGSLISNHFSDEFG